MRAMVLSAYKRLEVRDVPPPAAGESDVLVRVKACGICGSDVHGYDGSTGRRIPPLVMGHEAAGVVERVGRVVEDLRPGDRVTFDSTVSCGRCPSCREGRTNLCPSRRVVGVSCGEYRQDGAYAEYVSVPRHIVHRLPDGLPFEHAAMVEPVAVAVHAVGRVRERPRSAVVVGTGTIGLLVIQVLRAGGCEQIVAVEVDEGKRALARAVGADLALDPRSADVAAEVAGRTGGGADVALECVGASEPVQTAVASVRRGGAVVLVGNVTPSVPLPLQVVVANEITLLGTCASSGEYPRAIELLGTGAVDVRPLISLVAPLEEGPALFERLHARESGLLKVVLRP
ncbi:MAG TPA: galactitol-1-phosphate 5-dehydrogenase [Vicinamibacteria bacterium]|nr:galactitol-1-phosphate 5-dehydrogenase [Vicinamibacteria bacterium]